MSGLMDFNQITFVIIYMAPIVRWWLRSIREAS